MNDTIDGLQDKIKQFIINYKIIVFRNVILKTLFKRINFKIYHYWQKNKK